MDFGLFWGTTASATTVATAIASTGAWYARRRSQPEADWVPTGRWNWQESGRNGVPHKLYAHLKLLNAGDGAAFQVKVKGRGCTARIFTGPLSGAVPLVALMAPSEDFEVLISDIDEQAWDQAAVSIEWIHSPTRLKKIVRDEIALTDFLPDLPPRPEPR
jgi:hypothetical protein